MFTSNKDALGRAGVSSIYDGLGGRGRYNVAKVMGCGENIGVTQVDGRSPKALSRDPPGMGPAI
jgi:hypothetical protein